MVPLQDAEPTCLSPAVLNDVWIINYALLSKNESTIILFRTAIGLDVAAAFTDARTHLEWIVITHEAAIPGALSLLNSDHRLTLFQGLIT